MSYAGTYSPAASTASPVFRTNRVCWPIPSNPDQRFVSSAARPAEGQGQVVVIQPEVLLPGDDELALLSQADRHLVSKLTCEPFAYIDHPSLRAPRVEQNLFGGFGRLGRDATYFRETQASGICGIPRDGRLDATSERLGFQRFNYARKQVAAILQRYRNRSIPWRALREMLAWMHRVLMIRGWLVQSNIALVLAMSRQPRFCSLDRNEVISAGNYALLWSVDRFDWSRGFKFSTYACQGITQRMMHVLEATRRYRDRFACDFDETLDRDDSTSRRHEVQEQTCLDDLRDIIAGNRACLTEMERSVISHRFGLPDALGHEQVMTLREVGDAIGVTKERIRQIQKRALAKLRAALEREYLAA